MKLDDILSENPWLPPNSKTPPRKKIQKLRKLFRKSRGRHINRRLRDIAHGKDRTWIPDPDPMDYLAGHTDNGPKFT